MAAPPFRLTEALNLGTIPVDPQYFRFGVASLESDKYVAVRDKSADGTEQLTVVDMSNAGKVIRTKNDAEAALMHPSQNIIALRKAPDAGSTTVIVQVWNLDTKQKLKNCEFTEKIVFWHWVNNSKLAVVTANSAYHLNINNPNENQVKILDRASANPDSAQQILGYALEPNEKWCVVFGIGTPDGGKTINGSVQLYFIDAGKQQLLEGFAPTFGEVYIHAEDHKSLIFAFVEKKAGDPTIKIQMTEIGAPKEGFAKFKKFADLQLSPEFGNDFPIASHISTKYGLFYVVTKFGFVYVYEITSAQLVFKSRLSQDNVFCMAKSSEDGILALTRGGQVLSLNVEPTSFIPYLLNQCKHIPDIQSLAFKLAGRNKLTGMDSMFLDQFNRCIIAGDYAGAARTAADAPGTLLRNQETIAKFKSLQPQPGQPQPLLVYFSTLLEKGKLNGLESIELCGPVLAQGRKQLVEDWLNQDKLQCTPELGELVEKVDPSLALTVYKRSGNKEKEVQILMSLGRHDEAMQVSQAAGMKTDYTAIIKNILITNPEGALATAKGLVAKDPQINVHAIAELFLQANRVKEFTAFLVDCMRENKPEDGPCQTKALELNLMMAPHIAETIFQMEIWTQYNKQKIAPLCEQKGLMQRALENYTELKDIRRVILHTHVLNADALATYLGKLPAESLLACLGDLLRHNRQNVNLVVQVCTVQHPKIGVANIIKMFESLGNFDGIFLFLRGILNQTEDPDIYFKYIEAACKCNQFQAVEAVIKESTFYDPVKVKNLLKDLKIPDPRPLMYLCDMHGFIDELTRYLYQNNFQKFIEVYIFKVNPTAAPMVLGTLIDLECDEAYIKRLLGAIMSNCPIDSLIEEFDKRNKIRLLEGWLEARGAEGNQTPSIHNALAKICIDTNKDPQNFLMNNQYYDSKVIGKYCEERDPHLAYLAYKRAWGQCDMELIEVTNKNALYRLQARYLVERKSKELWALVLTPDNPHRRNIIEQVVSSALPDSKNVEEVSVAVSAFLEADIPNELMNLLEKIVLHNSEFSGFQKLQNLLIITAMKTDKTRVMDYINRLDNYDGPAMAKIALGEQYQLYEEAFVIYKKFKMNVEAIEVLVTNIDNIQRASEFAEKANQPEVWSKLAKAYLDREMVIEAIESYLKANDPKNYPSVILTAKTDGKYEQLIKFLLMARKQLKDGMIDSELAYAYAKLNKLAELEELVSNPNSIDVPSIGDKCYEDRLYEAAKIMYTQVKNNAKIASCLVHLKQFQAAIDAAKKANTPRTWKELCMACVAAGEFRLASVAGMNIIIHPDHLDDLIQHYEKYLVPDEMISLLETGMQLDHAHIGIFTELGILYAKYHPQKLMEHCKLHFSKLNITKLNRVCERYLLWNEAVYLYSHYDEFDTAVNIMIEHSPTAWQHELFVSTLQKVSNIDLYYKAVLFYVDEQPMLLNDLLKPLASKIDLTRLISTMKKTGYIALITPFLKNVQSQNNSAVNEALNNIYFENDDYENLRNSVTNFDNFDAQALASLCEKHQLLEFRRIAAFLYRKNKQYAQSIKLSKQDEIYRDAIETALESRSPELVDDLMKFFVGNGEKEFFTVTLYTCYELLKPDYVLELAWRFNLTDFAMPYFVQILRELTSKVEVVQKKHEDREKKDQKEAEAKQNEPIMFDGGLGMIAGGPLMLMGGPMGQSPMDMSASMGMGMGPGQYGNQFASGMGGGYGF